jgi:hypothetical protein
MELTLDKIGDLLEALETIVFRLGQDEMKSDSEDEVANLIALRNSVFEIEVYLSNHAQYLRAHQAAFAL